MLSQAQRTMNRFTSTSSRLSILRLSTKPRRKLEGIERPAPITVTDRAATRIKEMIRDKEDTIGVKIGVKRRGCNGYSYTMNYATTADVESKKFELVDSHGIKVLVDPMAIFYILGTEMDYQDTLLATEFTFVNPNSKGIQLNKKESFLLNLQLPLPSVNLRKMTEIDCSCHDHMIMN